MANININNLQATEIELIELSDLELDAVLGGNWWGIALGWIKDRGIKVGSWFFSAGWLSVSATYRW